MSIIILDIKGSLTHTGLKRPYALFAERAASERSTLYTSGDTNWKTPKLGDKFPEEVQIPQNWGCYEACVVR